MLLDNSRPTESHLVTAQEHCMESGESVKWIEQAREAQYIVFNKNTAVLYVTNGIRKFSL